MICLVSKDSFLASYLDVNEVRALLDRHRSGREDATDRIWSLVNLAGVGRPVSDGAEGSLAGRSAYAGSGVTFGGMNWKLKAAVQRGCAALPWGQEDAYYACSASSATCSAIPIRFRCLRSAPSWSSVARGGRDRGRQAHDGGGDRAAAGHADRLLSGRRRVHDHVRSPSLPQTGAGDGRGGRDSRNRERVRGYFAEVTDPAGLDRRLEAVCSVRHFADLLALAQLDYRAPGDAAATGLPAGSIDIHTSYTVFEHIPGPVLKAILMEANRILAPNGVALHHIDPSDHFAHADAAISRINFLQFSPEQWEKLAGNQFAYHNRLRPDGYAEIYRHCGHEILQWTPKLDARCRKLLDDGFPLDDGFRGLPLDVLSTTVLHVLSRPGRPT